MSKSSGRELKDTLLFGAEVIIATVVGAVVFLIVNAIQLPAGIVFGLIPDPVDGTLACLATLAVLIGREHSREILWGWVKSRIPFLD